MSGAHRRTFHTWILCGVLFAISGCSSDRTSLNGFSKAYSRLQDAVANLEVNSRLVFFDAEKNTGHMGYWDYASDSLDTHTTADMRFAASEAALRYYNERIQPWMDDWGNALTDVNSKVVLLAEKAAAIRTERHRDTATAIVQEARVLHEKSSSLYSVCRERFDIQVQMIGSTHDSSGALPRISIVREGPHIVELTEKSQSLVADIEAMKRRIQDSFAALKGATNLAVYPTEADKKP